MKTNDHPCIERVAHNNTPEELPDVLGEYISGCDYVCARKIGDAACNRFFRYDPPDESGIMAKQASHDFCVQDIVDDERLALANKARGRHQRKLQRKRMRGVLRSITRSKKKHERLFIADKNSTIVEVVEVEVEQPTPSMSSDSVDFADAQRFASQRYDAALYRDEPFGDDLVGTKSVPRGTIFDRRGGIRA